MSQPITDPPGGKDQDQPPGYWHAWLASGLALALTVVQFLWLPATTEIDFYGLASEAIICLIPLIGLFLIQHLRPHPRVYWAMMMGLTSLLLSNVTDALDEVRVQPEIVGILFEDGLSVLGYAFLVWGLARWIGYNRQIQGEIQALNAGLEQRIAERTASLAEMAKRQQAVEENYHRLLTVLNGMEAKIYLADMASHEILFLNQSAIQVFGPFEGEPCYRVLQGLDAPCPFCTNDKLVNADGSPTGVYAWEVQNRRNQRWYDLRDCAVPWTDGRLVRMEIATDITERKQFELRLRQSEERFRLAFENANTGMCLVDLQGRLMQVNDKMSAIFGYSRQELTGMTVNDLAYPEDLTVSEEYMSKAIQGLVENVTFDKRYRHRDGCLIHCQIASSLVRDQQGQPLYFISQVRDVTARREAEEQLRASEQRFRLVADHALDNIWTMGPDYRLRYISPSIQSLVGYSMEEYLGLTLEEMLMPDSLAVALAYFSRLDEHLAAGSPAADFPFRGEIELRTKEGAGIWTEIIVTPVEDAAGRLLELVGVTRDIRERKRYQAQLEQAREAAETATRAKSEFLAHMSHEIRTPMNGVLGLAQVLSREPLSVNQRELVGRIQAAGQSLLTILNDILDFSKIEAGQLRLETRPFDLAEALARVESLMGQTAQAKGLRLAIATPAESLGALLGDVLRLEQVLFNLTGNAIKFTERGEVDLSIQVLESSAKAIRLRFEVRDTGIGIAPAALSGLFEPFIQAEMGTSRRFGGTGLGLSISKRLVELMGGEIGAESQLGQGSTFWFELSFARAVGAPVSQSLPAPKQPTGARLSGVRVLVVDDSALNRDVVERVLGLEGAMATLAADGQQAVQHLRARPTAFDAILMDVRMPIMDGLTATRLIRRQLGLTDLPIIALTAGVLAGEQQAAREAGMNGLLPKPIDLEDLVAELHKWLPSPRPPLGEEVEVRTEDATRAPQSSPPPRAGRPLAASAPLPERGLGGGGEYGPQEFPSIPGIDRDRAIKTLGDDRDFFLGLLSGFVTEFAGAVEQTRRDLARGDRETARRRMHTLRGNAGNLCALELMEVAGELEEAIRKGETDLERGLESLGHQLAALSAASHGMRFD